MMCRSSTQNHSLRTLLIVVTMCCLFCSGVMSYLKWGNKAGKRASCHGLHVGVIALACRNYHDTYGTFPPAFIADETGIPVHSWRVLLLPFLEQGDLYARYDFSEPWNGPNNSKLAESMPEVYRCPAYEGDKRGMSNYVAVVGPQTAWPGDTSVPLSKITDRSLFPNPILVVEVADSDYCWLEPRDMSLEEAIRGVNLDMQHGISSYHDGGAFYGSVDGASHFLPNATEGRVLEAMLTISGGEILSVGENGVISVEQ